MKTTNNQKLKNCHCVDLHFLVKWEDRDQEDGHDLLDVLPTKAIVVDSDVDLESLGEGYECQALFNKEVYPVTIVGSGMLLKILLTNYSSSLLNSPCLPLSLSLSLSLSQSISLFQSLSVSKPTLGEETLHCLQWSNLGTPYS